MAAGPAMGNEEPVSRVLNLGAGNRIVPNAVNHDLRLHRLEIDIAWDLNNLPWPWEDGAFDHIIAWSVLEHLDIDLLTAMDECWRILDDRGTAEIKLPYWKHERAYNDPTHRRAYGRGIFNQLDPNTRRGQEYDFYTDRKWIIRSNHWCDRGRASFVVHLEVRK